MSETDKSLLAGIISLTMIEYFRLTNYKALSACTLSDLGKINVVCGKNSSGKSTVAEAINDANHREVGRHFNTSHAAAIQNSIVEYITSTHGIGWQIHGQSEHIRRIVGNACAAQEVWFSNNKQEFVDAIRRGFNDIEMLRQFANYAEGSKVQFDSIVGQDSRIVMLPPNRLLETSVNVSSGHDGQPSGPGVLKSLFLYQSSLESAPERANLEAIQNAFTEITSGYHFRIELNPSNILTLYFGTKTSQNISAQNCGLGLQEVLVMLYFIHKEDIDFLIIEEPETHLHPDMQRRLAAHLRKIEGKQFLLSTHSNVFINGVVSDRVFLTNFDNEVHISDVTSRALVLESLGYSTTDNLLSDLVILVEGPSDIPVIEELLSKLGFVSQYNIKLWPLGGDIMDQLDLSVFKQNYNLTALVDLDPKSRKVRNAFKKACNAQNIPITQLSRYALENYFTLEALREVFKGHVEIGVSAIDPKKSVESQIGWNVKKNNRRIAQAMSIDDIKGTDLDIFLRSIPNLIGA